MGGGTSQRVPAYPTLSSWSPLSPQAEGEAGLSFFCVPRLSLTLSLSRVTL